MAVAVRCTRGWERESGEHKARGDFTPKGLS